MRALVTGAGGFIGSHLAEHLAGNGWAVRAMVRYTSGGSIGMLADVDAAVRERLEIVKADLRDPDSVDRAVEGVDVVFNLAALIAIPYSYEAAESYIQTNVIGALNVLRAVRRHEVSRLVQTSTSETYGSAQYVPIDEQHPAHPQSPYAASKVASDQLALSFHRSFGTPVVVLRPFNTFGPRQSARAVIPTIVSQALFSDRICIGSTGPVRDFLFVRDTCAAFEAAATADGVVGEEFNCASGRGITIGDLIATACRVVRRSPPVEHDERRVRPADSEVNRLIGSYERLHRHTSWRPCVTLEDGLAQVAQWIASHSECYPTTEYVK